MEKINKDYAITLFENDSSLVHIIFDIRVRVKRTPTINGSVTINTFDTFPALAMIDTGASISGATNRLLKRMGVTSCGKYDFINSAGKGSSPSYIFDVIFPKDKLLENVEVLEISDDHAIDFLIGMNIIKLGDMAFTSENGKFAFSFRIPPAEKYIDFEQDLISKE